MSEVIKHRGVYVMTPENKIECHSVLPPDHRYNMERMRHQVLIFNGQLPRSAWYGSHHGIEWKSAHVQERVNTNYPFSRVEAWEANELAVRTNTREYMMPVNGHEDQIPGKLVFGSNGEVSGKLVDMNRQFAANGHPPSGWDEAIESVAYGPARLQLQLVRDHPSVKVMISVHEDPDRSRASKLGWLPFNRGRDGMYIYDVRERPVDPFDHVVDSQMRVFRDIARSRGYDLYNGRDDGEDAALNNRVRNGLVRQSVYDRHGKLRLDSSLEMYLVYLRSLGIGSVERAFVIEVPGRMEDGEKHELQTILSDTFLYPILGELDAL